jgi:hypothetical protein
MQNPSSASPAGSNSTSNQGADRGDLVCLKADALFRAAQECCRQHRHYATLVDRSVGVGEQRRVFRLVRLADENMRDAASAYERALGKDRPQSGEGWRRCAAGLWLAVREYGRRHSATESASEDLSINTAAKMGELAMEYDLEASALLLLQQAVDDYRKCRPDADLAAAARPAS